MFHRDPRICRLLCGWVKFHVFLIILDLFSKVALLWGGGALSSLRQSAEKNHLKFYFFNSFYFLVFNSSLCCCEIVAIEWKRNLSSPNFLKFLIWKM